MTAPARSVVVGTDGSAGAGEAVRWAARMASHRNLDLLIAHAMEATARFYGAGVAVMDELFDLAQSAAERIVTDARRVALSVDGTLPVATEAVSESAAALLVDLSRTARMVVLGNSGLSAAGGMLLGSAVATVVSQAHCPVAVVRDRDGTVPTGGPVVVGVDGSPTSEQAVGVAFEEASYREVPLVAVHAWSDITSGVDRYLRYWEFMEPDARRLLAQRLAGRQEEHPDVEVHRHLVPADPRTALLAESGGAQLVVVGSRGRGGFKGLLLGSTSQALVRRARCPVLVVRPEPPA
ncbi:universal stress protein [Amycolatopsis granulosa]|uniref:universal stress protein n=1 Tax=Amycolatopsis granulosa TaxID=185684 RepID=UPI0014203B13|nr:universal stress protein [Amycolatopsis granulosa]NIH83829.1 nucleotide-binding universal stress UspA family protein [Amycolatopsis granulosa]